MQVTLNAAQRDAVSFYFSGDNHEGEPWPLDEPVDIEVIDGQLVINTVYLHADGNWATWVEPVEGVA